MKFFPILLTILSLSGCAVFRTHIESSEKAKIKKIAVFSDLGPALNYHYAGSTALRNHDQKIKIDWDLDKIIEDTLVENLKQDTSYAAVETVSKEITKRPYLDQMVTFKKNGVKIEHYLKDIERLGYDALVVVQAWKQIEDESVPPGYGIFYNNRLILQDQNFYMNARIRVYSTHSKKELISDDFWPKPYMSLEEYAKRKTWEEWPATDVEKIKKNAQDAVKEEATGALSRIGLR